MVLDEIVHKYAMSVGVERGGNHGKVAVIGILMNNPRPTVDKERMDTRSKVVLMVGRTCYNVSNPYGS